MGGVGRRREETKERKEFLKHRTEICSVGTRHGHDGGIAQLIKDQSRNESVEIETIKVYKLIHPRSKRSNPNNFANSIYFQKSVERGREAVG